MWKLLRKIFMFYLQKQSFKKNFSRALPDKLYLLAIICLFYQLRVSSWVCLLNWPLWINQLLKWLSSMLIFFDAVIDDKTCEERLWSMKHRGETNFYLCEINRDMVIDATYKGNKSRYINHSCCPNTEMQKWFSTHSFSFLVFQFAHKKIWSMLNFFFTG